MNDNDLLYIPMGLKEKTEYWNGFGKEEAIKALIFVAFAGTIDLIIYLCTKNIPFCVVFLLSSIGGSIMMLTKDTTNLSVVDQVQNMIRFARSQKRYPYKALDEW